MCLSLSSVFSIVSFIWRSVLYWRFYCIPTYIHNVSIGYSSTQREPETSLESLLASGHRLIDVRTETEYNGNTATSATNMPLATLPTQLDRLDR